MSRPVPPLPAIEALPEGKGAPCLSAPEPVRDATPVPDAADRSVSTHVESEHLMRGNAALYAYGADTDEVVVAREGSPYATRILIRFPRDPDTFSGTVVIDVAHPENGMATMWWLARDHILRCNHAYVLVTTLRDTLAYGTATPVTQLHDFDPERYASVHVYDGGQSWDVVAQLCALVRDAERGPLPVAAQKVLVGGYSGAGAYTLMFTRSFHDRWSSPAGGPIVDGYLVGEPSWYQQISGLDTRMPETQAVRDLDVPVISVYSGAQHVVDHMVGVGASRVRDDLDAPRAGVRTYELAGSAHSARPGCGFPASDLRLGNLFHLAFHYLVGWSDGALVPPRAARVALAEPADDSRPRTQLDRHGNAEGGVRSVQLDVPVARYFTCRDNGAGVMEAFSPDKLVALYGDRAGYLDAA